MALSQAEIKQVLDAIKAESQDLTTLDVATSLNGITSLPAMQAAKMVLAPLALLSKPAQDAAAIANNAAASANTAASNANTAATNANAMATSLETYGTDVAAIRAAIISLRDDLTRVEADLDALDHDNATEAIESFREILAFLDGCKDDETLLAKLTEIKALITAEATDRQSAIAQALNTAQVADAELQEQIAEHRRELHYLPDNFATEKALFTAAGTYTIGTQPIKPGALLLGCVDECWGVYQYVYFNDEVEISAQSEEAVQAVPATAPPAVKHDTNISNPDNWVRLATVEDVNAALDALNIYNFGTLELDFTSDNWFTIIPQDAICPQTDGIFAAWEAGKKIVGRFVVTKRVQQGNSSSMVTQPFDSFTIDYGGEDSHTHNPSIRFHCLSADTSDTNIRVRSVRVYFSRYSAGEDLKYAYGSSAMSQIDLPPGLNVNDWTNRIGERLTALEKNVPVVELTAEEIAAFLPHDDSQIATLELDAEDDMAVTDEPATCEALERFRTRLREMRGRSVFKPKEVYNPNDYINSYEHE